MEAAPEQITTTETPNAEVARPTDEPPLVSNAEESLVPAESSTTSTIAAKPEVGSPTEA